MRRHDRGAALSLTQTALRVLGEQERRFRAQASSAKAAGDSGTAEDREHKAEQLRLAREVLEVEPLPS